MKKKEIKEEKEFGELVDKLIDENRWLMDELAKGTRFMDTRIEEALQKLNEDIRDDSTEIKAEDDEIRVFTRKFIKEHEWLMKELAKGPDEPLDDNPPESAKKDK